jgi:uncharacterized membrane protein YhaH (DUF805 family)
MGLVSLYCSGRGRMPRETYWLASLPLLPFSILPELILRAEPTAQAALFALALWLATLVPTCILARKRCHDRDRSGWFLLYSLIPLIGPVWLLIDLGFFRGTNGPNRFGPDPLAATPDGASTPILG